MATVTSSKLITLDILSYFKRKMDTVIDEGDAKAFKAVDYANNTLKFYKKEDKSDVSPVEISLPEEMFLDQAKTVFVDSFAWSDAAYPGSVDPSLEGKPVMVLAVKGDTTTTYSFVNLEKLVDVYTGEETATIATTVSGNKISANAKISADADNVIEAKADGLYVAKPNDVTFTYAAESDIDALF